MSLKRILSLLSTVALLSTLVACGSGGSGKTNGSLDESTSVAVRIGNAGIAPTATVNPGGGATTDKQIVLGTGTGATVTIPGATGLLAGGFAIPGTPKITANVTSYLGALPAGVPTTGLVTTNGNVTVRITITTDTGVNVDGFTAPLTVKMLTTMAPGSVFNYYSFNGVTWVLEGSVIVAADGTVTFPVTHLSDWTAVGTEISTASASVLTAQKAFAEPPTKTVEEAILSYSTATTLSDLKVSTKVASINIAAGTYLFSTYLPPGKAVEKTVEVLPGFLNGAIEGNPPATLTATSYLTYIPTSLATELAGYDFDNVLTQALDKQVLSDSIPKARKPVAVLSLDAKAGPTGVAGVITSQFAVALKSAPTPLSNYICMAKFKDQGWKLIKAGPIGDGTIAISNGSLFKGGLGLPVPVPTAIVCKDTELTGVWPLP